MPIKFHLDEHVHPAIAEGLRRRGIDVTTTNDVGLRGSSDADQLSYVRGTDRVMVTMDADFLRLASVGEGFPGIVYSEQGARSIGELLELLVVLHGCLSPDEMQNHIEFL